MTQRPERIRPYPTAKYIDGRHEYLRLNDRRVKFCQVVESRVAGAAGRDPENQGWQKFPWLTLVIGSGCLEVPAASVGIARAMSRAVLDQLRQFDSRWDIEIHEGLVSDFTSSLVEDRLMSGRRQEHTSQDETEPRQVAVEAAQLAFAAALLTQVYHLVSTAYPRAMSRWEEDVAEVDPEHGAIAAAEIDALVTTTEEVLQTVRARLQQLGEASNDETVENVYAAVCRLLGVIYTDLSKDGRVRRVSAQRLRLLTEVAWYFLIRDTPIYPGWTDLLLRLMLAQSTGDQQRSPRRPRPRYSSLLELADAARSVLVVPTERSWDATRAGTDDELSRQRLYRAAAATLWAQADAHHSRLAQSSDVPPPAAFMTTLDIELEMALTATEPDRPFSVAVPVYVVPRRDADEAEFCWLMADVPPAPEDDLGDLDRLRRPLNWRVLDERGFRDEPRDRPLVIHLSGCPLIELPGAPQISDQMRQGLQRAGIDVTPRTVLVPAITVDEYLAMRQSENELSMLNRGNPDPKSRSSRGLPESLTQTGSKAGTVRYWLVMGVPMADPAVRNRVLAQVTAVHRKHADSHPVPGAPGRLSSPSKLGLGPSEPPESGDGAGRDPSGGGDLSGAAVTLHIDDDEVALLHWLGLDVVEASCHAYSDDLAHYALHVRSEGEDKRPPISESCTLKAGRR
jgi:hypothetical protein